MYKNLFAREWIKTEVVDYLMTIPELFRIFYTVDANGREIDITIRDENGELQDFDRRHRNVIGIGIQYQEDGFAEVYSVNGIIDSERIPYMKEKFGKFIKKYPETASKLKARHLYGMQCSLRKEIERITNVIGAYDGKNIVYNLGALNPDARNRVLDTIRRFGKDCVSTTLMVTISGSTDEEIGATLNELAMSEMSSEQDSTNIDYI